MSWNAQRSRPSDPLDKRDYGGWFDAKGHRARLHGVHRDPDDRLSLDEIAAGFCALESGGIRFEGEQRQIMQEVEERALEKMLASFKRNLFYHIDMENEANKSGFYYVPLRDLHGTLKKIGVL